MATRLYFHNAANTLSGKFNQGQAYNAVSSYGIAYGNNIYVKGSGLGVQVSTNGIDWGDVITIFASLDTYGVTFGNGYFMAASKEGQVFRSTNGTTWTQVRGPTGGSAVVQNFVYAGSYWFLCMSVGVLSVATGDGSVWTDQDPLSNPSTSYRFAAYNSVTGEYAIIGFTTTSAMRKTTTPAVLASWTAVTGPTSVAWSSLVYDNSNALWILGSSSTTNTTNIYTTPTLSATPTWTARTVTGTVARNWYSVTGGGITVNVGDGHVVSSSNGTSWTNYNTTGLTPAMTTQIWYSATYDGTYFYIMSQVGVMMRSTDGASWSRVGGPLSNTPESINQTPLATPPTTAYKLKSMDTTIGTNQTSLTLTTAAISTAQNNFIGFFVSPKLLRDQTVGGGNIILNCADAEANLASNWWINGLCVYVWRPSTGTIVGYVRDYQGTSLGGTEATSASSIQVTHITGITSSAVSAQAGDVIICEIWATATQGMSTAYANTFYFDGTTVNTTENAVVTSQASFIEFTENLTFGTSRSFSVLI